MVPPGRSPTSPESPWHRTALGQPPLPTWEHPHPPKSPGSAAESLVLSHSLQHPSAAVVDGFGTGREGACPFHGSSCSKEPGEGLGGAGILTARLGSPARTCFTWPDLTHPLPCLQSATSSLYIAIKSDKWAAKRYFGRRRLHLGVLQCWLSTPHCTPGCPHSRAVGAAPHLRM